MERGIRLSGCLTALVALTVVTSPVWAQVQPGDYVLVSRRYGSIYAVDPANGQIRGLLSGLELRDQSGLVRGDGPTLVNSFGTAIGVSGNGALYVRFATSATDFGLLSVHPLTGTRALMSGSNAASWSEVGEVVPLPNGTLLTAADDWPGGAGHEGKLLRYNPKTGATTVVSGGGVGDGPVLAMTRALGLLDNNTAVVAEWQLNLAPPYAGAGLYTVNLQTGERTFLSRIWPQLFRRQVRVGGQIVNTPVLSRGAGPVFNLQVRSLTVMNGRILLGESIKLANGSYNGGVLEVDPVSGDRTLLVGKALVDDGTAATVVTALPVGWSSIFLDEPVGLLPTESGRLAFTCMFGPSQIFEYDLAANELAVVADVGAQLDPNNAGNVEFSGLTVARALSGVGDLNCDGLVDFGDINPFVQYLSNSSAWQTTYPGCPLENGDINGDGTYGYVSFGDINPFVTLLTGG